MKIDWKSFGITVLTVAASLVVIKLVAPYLPDAVRRYLPV